MSHHTPAPTAADALKMFKNWLRNSNEADFKKLLDFLESNPAAEDFFVETVGWSPPPAPVPRAAKVKYTLARIYGVDTKAGGFAVIPVSDRKFSFVAATITPRNAFESIGLERIRGPLAVFAAPIVYKETIARGVTRAYDPTILLNGFQLLTEILKPWIEDKDIQPVLDFLGALERPEVELSTFHTYLFIALPVYAEAVERILGEVVASAVAAGTLSDLDDVYPWDPDLTDPHDPDYIDITPQRDGEDDDEYRDRLKGAADKLEELLHSVRMSLFRGPKSPYFAGRPTPDTLLSNVYLTAMHTDSELRDGGDKWDHPHPDWVRASVTPWVTASKNRLDEDQQAYAQEGPNPAILNSATTAQLIRQGTEQAVRTLSIQQVRTPGIQQGTIRTNSRLEYVRKAVGKLLGMAFYFGMSGAYKQAFYRLRAATSLSQFVRSGDGGERGLTETSEIWKPLEDVGGGDNWSDAIVELHDLAGELVLAQMDPDVCGFDDGVLRAAGLQPEDASYEVLEVVKLMSSAYAGHLIDFWASGHSPFDSSYNAIPDFAEQTLPWFSEKLTPVLEKDAEYKSLPRSKQETLRNAFLFTILWQPWMGALAPGALSMASDRILARENYPKEYKRFHGDPSSPDYIPFGQDYLEEDAEQARTPRAEEARKTSMGAARDSEAVEERVEEPEPESFTRTTTMGVVGGPAITHVHVGDTPAKKKTPIEQVREAAAREEAEADKRQVTEEYPKYASNYSGSDPAEARATWLQQLGRGTLVYCLSKEWLEGEITRMDLLNKRDPDDTSIGVQPSGPSFRMVGVSTYVRQVIRHPYDIPDVQFPVFPSAEPGNAEIVVTNYGKSTAKGAAPGSLKLGFSGRVPVAEKVLAAMGWTVTPQKAGSSYVHAAPPPGRSVKVTSKEVTIPLDFPSQEALAAWAKDVHRFYLNHGDCLIYPRLLAKLERNYASTRIPVPVSEDARISVAQIAAFYQAGYIGERPGMEVHTFHGAAPERRPPTRTFHPVEVIIAPLGGMIDIRYIWRFRPHPSKLTGLDPLDILDGADTYYSQSASGLRWIR